MSSRIIAHIDMDAFFAAVEQRDNPDLKGKPIIIGADPKGGGGRGVVSTCSYEARKFGIHSAMPISHAYQRCPQGVYLPPDMERYHEASRQVFAIFYDFTPTIQPISCDEAFLELTGSLTMYGTPRAIAQKIKQRIKEEVGLTASVGLASNKMIAKIASDYDKPDGLCIVKPSQTLKFLHPLDIKRLWGVGKKTEEVLRRMNINTIGDLARLGQAELIKQFGDFGQHLHLLANGIDDRPVETEREIKSVSHEHTFDEDTGDLNQLAQTLLHLTEKVSRRLRKYDLKGRTITIKIRLKGFKTYTRSITIDHRTNHVHDILDNAKRLLDEFYRPGMEVRLIGVKVDQFFDAYVQESLFTDNNQEKKEAMHQALDVIKDKFGENTIHFGLNNAVNKARKALVFIGLLTLASTAFAASAPKIKIKLPKQEFKVQESIEGEVEVFSSIPATYS